MVSFINVFVKKIYIFHLYLILNKSSGIIRNVTKIRITLLKIKYDFSISNPCR